SGTGAIPDFPSDDPPWYQYSNNITAVDIQNGVTSIGEYAFYNCSELTSVTIPNSVTGIRDGAFYSCNGLTSVTISNSVTSIDYAAFAFCSALTSITIPNSVTSIGSYAFYNCSALTSITIPNSVTSIGYAAFAFCSALTSITCNAIIPPSVGNNAFENTSIPLYVPVCSVSAYQSAPIWNSFANIIGVAVDVTPTVITLPALNVTYSSATLNKTVIGSCEPIISQGFQYKKVGESNWLASESGNLTGLIVGTQYEFYAYATTASGTVTGDTLTFTTLNISLSCPNPIAFGTIGNIIWTLCPDSTLTISGTGAIPDFPSDDPPWYEHRNYTTAVDIQNGITSIGEYAFFNLSSLTSVTISNSVTSIGYAAFAYCSDLTSITIPNSVTIIGEGAFFNCSGLTSITIPNSVTSIGDLAFTYCVGLTSITCNATIPPSLGSDAFTDVPTNIPVIVPCGSSAAYQAAANWNDFTNIIDNCPKSVRVLSNNAALGTAIGSGTYYFNASVTIAAIPVQGNVFAVWNDGNTDNPRSIIITQDTTFTATFAADAQITALKADTAALRAALINCNNNGDSLQNVINALQADTTILKEQIIALQRDTIALNNQIGTLNAQITTFTNQVSNLQSDTIALNAQIATLISNLVECNSYKTVLQSQITALQADTTALQNEINALNISITALQAALDDCLNQTGIEQIMTADVEIYPNPTETEIFIRSEQAIEKVDILDIAGRTIMNNAQLTINNAINISALPQGVYFAKIFIDGQSITKKIIKK
ncbi:MAG: leucine-rich repeat protein, partial [Paludibacter sp.]|nr:leucine-rich repeat protein [Paludibacter sp.]